MTREDQKAFIRILRAHADTIAICEACATTTRDLAAEVSRGGVPARDALDATVAEAEQVLVGLVGVRLEVERLLRTLATQV